VSDHHEWIGIGTKSAKRKCALVVGYLGSNYKGLQLDEKSTLKFIEGELRDALVRVSAISELNSISLSKVDWSRSSRTDKGVHASKVIISLKIEIPQPLIDQEDSEIDKAKYPSPNRLIMEPIRFKRLVEAVNIQLPADIRVFSCTLVNNRFNARDVCKWRAYKYILPASLLTAKVDPGITHDDSQSGDSRDLNTEVGVEHIHNNNHDDHDFTINFQRFKQALLEMEGSHSFHNYNNLSGRDIKKSRKQESDRMWALNNRHASSSPSSISSQSTTTLDLSDAVVQGPEEEGVDKDVYFDSDEGGEMYSLSDDDDDDDDDKNQDSDISSVESTVFEVKLRNKPYGDDCALL